MVRQFYYRMRDPVFYDGDCSDAFLVSNGVKQGCVLAPALFSLVFSAMQNDVFWDSNHGVCINYRTDRKLFNLHRPQTLTKVRKTVLRDFPFADAYTLNAASEPVIQRVMESSTPHVNNFGLTISTKKTEVMHPASSRSALYWALHHNEWPETQDVGKFTYLVPSQEKSTLMMRSVAGSQRSVSVLEDYVTFSEKEGESALKPSSKFGWLSSYPSSCMCVKHGLRTEDMHIISTILPYKSVQDPES